MPHFRYECFCEFHYDQDISYEDLLACEAEVTQLVQTCLQENGGVHLDFVPTSDSLLAHCLFAIQEQEHFASLCREFSSIAVGKVDGRVILIDKHGDTMLIGYTANGKSRLTAIRLPTSKEGIAGKKPLCSLCTEKKGEKKV